MASEALVTGASTGIGRATVKILAGRGWRVFAGVRKRVDADSLRQEFGDTIHPLLFDVTDAAAVRAAAAEIRVALNGRTLKGLVNNAGMALGGPLALQPLDEIRRVFEVNVFGAVSVSQAVIPLLGADRTLTGGPGRIVNITSVAGKFAPPFLGDYAMSKHALEAFSEALRRELMIYGIDVIAIGPGAVVTPIWDKAEQMDESVYALTRSERREVQGVLHSGWAQGPRSGADRRDRPASPHRREAEGALRNRTAQIRELDAPPAAAETHDRPPDLQAVRPATEREDGMTQRRRVRYFHTLASNESRVAMTMI